MNWTKLLTIFFIYQTVSWAKVDPPNYNFSLDQFELFMPGKTLDEISKQFPQKELLIKQIESRVRWRESVNFMIKNGTKQFIEIGPGKVLSGLIKRIDKNVKVSAINNEEDIKIINLND